jgi:predicted nucleotidyltransferase
MDIDSSLASLRDAIVAATGSSLSGLYLFGSLATGDFDAAVSDIDLIAVLVDTPTEQLAERLRRMHADFAEANPEWDDRIEVVYISEQGLATCRTDATTIAVISPGEPFHVVQASRDWILNWYPAREDAVRLLGPPMESLIPPIPLAEYVEEVRRYLLGFRHRIADDAPPGSQAYAILAMCRGLYTIGSSERVSKREAGAWAQERFPRWADLIGRALNWRQAQRDPQAQDGRATVPETRAFVAELAMLVSDGRPARSAADAHPL